MTNRDYLRGLSNEKLAEFIFSKKEEICDAINVVVDKMKNSMNDIGEVIKRYYL